jgi:hypothetical protein
MVETELNQPLTKDKIQQKHHDQQHRSPANPGPRTGKPIRTNRAFLTGLSNLHGTGRALFCFHRVKIEEVINNA